MNRHSTGRRGRASDRAAAARFARLRAAGVPTVLSSKETWYLSGGVLGGGPRGALDADPSVTYSLAYIVKRVPDCEEFLPDWQEQW